MRHRDMDTTVESLGEALRRKLLDSLTVSQSCGTMEETTRKQDSRIMVIPNRKKIGVGEEVKKKVVGL